MTILPAQNSELFSRVRELKKEKDAESSLISTQKAEDTLGSGLIVMTRLGKGRSPQVPDGLLRPTGQAPVHDVPDGLPRVSGRRSIAIARSTF